MNEIFIQKQYQQRTSLLYGTFQSEYSDTRIYEVEKSFSAANWIADTLISSVRFFIFVSDILLVYTARHISLVFSPASLPCF